MSDQSNIQLFSIIYNANPGKPMEFIQEEFTKAKIAIEESEEKYKAFMDRYDYHVSLESSENAALPESENESAPKEPVKLLITNPRKIKESIGETSIQCCICGEHFKTLGAHLKRAHQITADEYKELCGFPRETNLMSLNFLKEAQSYAQNAFKFHPRNKKNVTVSDTGDVILTENEEIHGEMSENQPSEDFIEPGSNDDMKIEDKVKRDLDLDLDDNEMNIKI